MPHVFAAISYRSVSGGYECTLRTLATFCATIWRSAQSGWLFNALLQFLRLSLVDVTTPSLRATPPLYPHHPVSFAATPPHERRGEVVRPLQPEEGCPRKWAGWWECRRRGPR